ncbi:hypothetical protein [Pseudomonas baltica]|uniref:hypothetical protein n=1 Tax=Pseudomonas baltica TaxID=2762576 RepID=UPI00289E8829|nr:hypothetical protein [Pseudomonas baltica]
MPMKRANRELRHDLEAALQHLEDYAGELFRQATVAGPDEFSGAMARIAKLHYLVDRIGGYVEEIKDRKITRE